MGNFKTEIQCIQCGEHWMVGDRERTVEEKRHWLCPKCLELVSIRSDEAKVDEAEQEEKVQSPKDEPAFYNE
jgi:predicted RNA-binding Zn-ribbon protein involved in translation (DUF1610 family)